MGASTKRAALLLLALGCGEPADRPTALRLTVMLEASWGVEQLEVVMGEGRWVVPEAPAAIAPGYRVVILVAPGGERTVGVWGLAGGDRIAHGEAAATPVARQTVEVDLALARLPCGDYCIEDSTQCEGDGVVTCAHGAGECLMWSKPAACGAAEPFCSLGECMEDGVDECARGARTCDGPSAYRVCGEADSDAWNDWEPAVACPDGETCSSGVCATDCADECSAGASECFGVGRRVCGQYDPDDCREWGPMLPCPYDKVCASGACAERCEDECEEGACDGLEWRACGQFDLDACRDRAVAPCATDDPCLTAMCDPDAGCGTVARADAPEGCESEGEPDIAVTPEEIDFGAPQLGEEIVRSVTIANDGDAPLVVTAITATDDTGPEGEDEFAPEEIDLPLPLEPGELREVSIAYVPADGQADTGRVEIASDDPDAPTVTVELAGELKGQPWLCLCALREADLDPLDPESCETEEAISFDGLAHGASAERDVVVWNCAEREDANAPLEVASAALTADTAWADLYSASAFAPGDGDEPALFPLLLPPVDPAAPSLLRVRVGYMAEDDGGTVPAEALRLVSNDGGEEAVARDVPLVGVVAGCPAGFTDANGDPADGCESACVPTGAEVCNGLDDDCDGQIDHDLCEGCGSDFVDLDGEAANGCECGPVTTETCNDDDDDCDGAIDEDCGPCPEDMVLVPAGAFMMGCNTAVDSVCSAYPENPYHSVTLSAFEIDRTEVTVAAYGVCVTDGACTAPSTGSYCNWGVAGRDAHPVNCMDWYQAEDYCAFAGKRLPTEAEWERSARGTDGRKYPWGNVEPDCTRAVYWGCFGSDGTEPVCSSPAGNTPVGLRDMAGNVNEWVSDWYDADYYEVSPASDPPGPASSPFSARVVRGGSWDPDSVSLRAGSRDYGGPAFRSSGLGVRCARTVLP